MDLMGAQQSVRLRDEEIFVCPIAALNGSTALVLALGEQLRHHLAHFSRH